MNRTAWLIAAMMCASSLFAFAIRPETGIAGKAPDFSLDAAIPARFGDWQLEPVQVVQVINPQDREVLDKLYNQILERIYVNADGYVMILSVAYAADQRGSLRAHEPEFCYVAQGFTLQHEEAMRLTTPFGEIPVRRLLMARGSRAEQITYWLKTGGQVNEGWREGALDRLKRKLTRHAGLEGLVFRVSSIDPDQVRSTRLQNGFIVQLLDAVPPADRARLSGLEGVRR